jgi:hypothetical protein
MTKPEVHQIDNRLILANVLTTLVTHDYFYAHTRMTLGASIDMLQPTGFKQNVQP